MTYEQAIRNLNDAAYEAMKVCGDHVARSTIRRIALDTDKLVDEAGPVAEEENRRLATREFAPVAGAAL